MKDFSVHVVAKYKVLHQLKSHQQQKVVWITPLRVMSFKPKR